MRDTLSRDFSHPRLLLNVSAADPRSLSAVLPPVHDPFLSLFRLTCLSSCRWAVRRPLSVSGGGGWLRLLVVARHTTGLGAIIDVGRWEQQNLLYTRMYHAAALCVQDRRKETALVASCETRPTTVTVARMTRTTTTTRSRVRDDGEDGLLAVLTSRFSLFPCVRLAASLCFPFFLFRPFFFHFLAPVLSLSLPLSRALALSFFLSFSPLSLLFLSTLSPTTDY